MKFATVRLGKTSVQDIKSLSAMPKGVVPGTVQISVVCTQVPEELSNGTIVFIWLGSDNSKGMPTEWTQGFKAVGVVSNLVRGARYSDESTSTLQLKYAFKDAVTRLDVLRECPEAYYWCSSLPIIGLDDHSNQTIRCIPADSERGEIGAFLFALNAVHNDFRAEITSVLPEVGELFWDSVKSPKTGEMLSRTPQFKDSNFPRQLITYGAPGTGKSFGTATKIKEFEAKDSECVVRTTFHPDSDYSTFVGTYKPTMESCYPKQDCRHLTVEQLATILKDEYDSAGEGSEKGKALAVDLFAEKYYEYLDGRFGKVSLKELIEKAGLPSGYNVGIRDSINVARYHAAKRRGEKRIVYKFVPQAFIKAYVRAWKKMGHPNDDLSVEPQFLVIEEINRGNCAQIFGDLFQLLDRNTDDGDACFGLSTYPIDADDDLRNYLGVEDVLGGLCIPNLVKCGIPEKLAEEISNGQKLALPPNLYIWATMNTSDQSLFPIDSAFKRRWAWKYIPISNANKNYSIEVGSDKYDWWTFLDKANTLVESFTESEDKKLGYFFCKADKHSVISLEQFVGKVVFYLWNGVFKDTGFDDEVFDDGKGGKLYFKTFFNDNGDPNPESVKQFMKNLGIGAAASTAGNAGDADGEATTEPPPGSAENTEGQGQ